MDGKHKFFSEKKLFWKKIWINLKQYSKVLYKNDILKNFAKFTGSTCAKIYVNIIKNRLHHPHVFLWICEVFKNNFYEGYLRAAFPVKLESEHPITLKKTKESRYISLPKSYFAVI